jgi:hypothetical protein
MAAIPLEGVALAFVLKAVLSQANQAPALAITLLKASCEGFRLQWRSLTA